MCQHSLICISFYIGTNENSMKIRMWTVVLLTAISKARNHCQDVHHCGNRCQDREHCQNGNEHADDQDQWSAMKYN